MTLYPLELVRFQITVFVIATFKCLYLIECPLVAGTALHHSCVRKKHVIGCAHIRRVDCRTQPVTLPSPLVPV